LQAADDEVSEALKINSKIARMLHNATAIKNMTDEEAREMFVTEGIIVNNEPYTTILFFKFMMERGENI
jgi:hypothetical protein